MNRRTIADLTRWEDGEIGADDLIERHPDARAAVEAYAWVAYAAGDATDEGGPAWEDLAVRLADRPAPAQEERRCVPVRRIAVAGLIGAVLTPATALATGLDVDAAARRVAERVARPIVDVFTPRFGEEAGLAPAGSESGRPVGPGAVVIGPTRLMSHVSEDPASRGEPGAPSGEPADGDLATPRAPDGRTGSPAREPSGRSLDDASEPGPVPPEMPGEHDLSDTDDADDDPGVPPDEDGTRVRGKSETRGHRGHAARVDESVTPGPHGGDWEPPGQRDAGPRHRPDKPDKADKPETADKPERAERRGGERSPRR